MAEGSATPEQPQLNLKSAIKNKARGIRNTIQNKVQQWRTTPKQREIEQQWKADKFGELKNRYKQVRPYIKETAQELIQGKGLDTKQRQAVQKGSFVTAERLYAEAMTDKLTGLPNRAALMQKLEEQINQSERFGIELAVLLIDLDGFKGVNDQAGHKKGDECLIETGVDLQKSLRETDTVARLGGDEFAVILPGATNGAAVLAAEKLKNNYQQAMDVWSKENGITIPPSMTVGVASHRKGLSASELLHQADLAMYDGKHSVKNIVVPYKPEMDVTIERERS